LLSLAPYGFSGEHELCKSIEDISFKFTQNREQLDSYLSSDKEISAYMSFYFPTHYPKFSYLLSKVPSLHDGLKKAHFVDVGSGPGTFMLAYLDLFPLSNAVYGIENSVKMKQVALKVLAHYYPQKEIHIVQNKEGLLLKGPVWLNFGHSLNEMQVEIGLEIIKKLNPTWISFLEPGTLQSFKVVNSLRSSLLQNDFKNYFPCPNSQAMCPMEGADNWCHQNLFSHFHPEVERLMQKVKKDRFQQNMVAHLWGKDFVSTEVSSKKSNARVVRFSGETKFSFELEACINDETQNSNDIVNFVILKKKHEKKLLKKLKNSLLGMELTYSILGHRKTHQGVLTTEIQLIDIN